MKKMILFFLTVCFFGINNSQAQSSIKRTQVNQNARIAQGVRSGELTQRETKQLVVQQKNIQNMKRVAAADGKITRAERRVINKSQNRASRNIRRQKNDCQSRR